MLSCGCVSALRPYSSRLLTTPSDLAPMSTRISSLSMRTTVPSTTSPCLRLRISPDCSLSSSSMVVGSGRVVDDGLRALWLRRAGGRRSGLAVAAAPASRSGPPRRRRSCGSFGCRRPQATVLGDGARTVLPRRRVGVSRHGPSAAASIAASASATGASSRLDRLGAGPLGRRPPLRRWAASAAGLRRPRPPRGLGLGDRIGASIGRCGRLRRGLGPSSALAVSTSSADAVAPTSVGDLGGLGRGSVGRRRRRCASGSSVGSAVVVGAVGWLPRSPSLVLFGQGDCSPRI